MGRARAVAKQLKYHAPTLLEGETSLPNLTGRTLAEARGLLPRLAVTAAGEGTDGHVVDQYPEPGAVLPIGSEVKVWLSDGPPGGAGVREPRRPVPPAPAGRKARQPDQDSAEPR